MKCEKCGKRLEFESPKDGNHPVRFLPCKHCKAKENEIDLFTGEELRDEGIKRAVDNADDKNESWSAKAYNFLIHYLVRNKGREFMAENVRVESEGAVPPPPSKRAWGGIILRAANNGLIEKEALGPVTNPTAHCANASIWRIK